MTAGSPELGGAAPSCRARTGRAFHVTAAIGGQVFAIPIGRVQNVFPLSALTPVPLAPPDVLGLMNLRGRFVTALDIRARLGLPHAAPAPGALAIGVEAGPDSFGVLVDRIGDVVELGPETRRDVPVTPDERWSGLSRAVHQVGPLLVIEVDVDEMLGLSAARSGGVSPPLGGLS